MWLRIVDTEVQGRLYELCFALYCCIMLVQLHSSCTDDAGVQGVLYCCMAPVLLMRGHSGGCTMHCGVEKRLYCCITPLLLYNAFIVDAGVHGRLCDALYCCTTPVLLLNASPVA